MDREVAYAASCGHLSRDFNGNCMRCAHEAQRRADMAQAWDEGHGTSNGGCVYWPDCAKNGDHVNPYRATPPEVGSTDAPQ